MRLLHIYWAARVAPLLRRGVWLLAATPLTSWVVLGLRGRNKEKRVGSRDWRGGGGRGGERQEETGQRRDGRTGISGRCKRDGKGFGLKDKEEKNQGRRLEQAQYVRTAAGDKINVAC